MEALGIQDVEITMPGYSKKIVADKEVIYYNITLGLEPIIWKLEKRFNDFVELHDELTMLLPRTPKIPEKTMMRKSDDAFIINRKCKLELYLRDLMKFDEIITAKPFI